MIAVIETGGKQYLVKAGQTLKIEKIKGEDGEKVVFDRILLTADDDGGNVKIGAPILEGVTIEAIVEKQGRSRKIRVEKFKRKTRYHKVQGHRQKFTQVKLK